MSSMIEHVLCSILIVLSCILIVWASRTIRRANLLINIAEAHAVITDRKEERLDEKLETVAGAVLEKVLSTPGSSDYFNLKQSPPG